MIFKSVSKLLSIPFYFILLLCVLVVFGCGNNQNNTGKSVNEKKIPGADKIVTEKESQVAGRYLNEKEPRVFIELKSDKTFFFSNGGSRKITGKYVIADKNISLLTPKSEKGIEAVFEGNSIITTEGVRYTKQ